MMIPKLQYIDSRASFRNFNLIATGPSTSNHYKAWRSVGERSDLPLGSTSKSISTTPPPLSPPPPYLFIVTYCPSHLLSLLLACSWLCSLGSLLLSLLGSLSLSVLVLVFLTWLLVILLLVSWLSSYLAWLFSSLVFLAWL